MSEKDADVKAWTASSGELRKHFAAAPQPDYLKKHQEVIGDVATPIALVEKSGPSGSDATEADHTRSVVGQVPGTSVIFRNPA